MKYNLAQTGMSFTYKQFEEGFPVENESIGVKQVVNKKKEIIDKQRKAYKL